MTSHAQPPTNNSALAASATAGPAAARPPLAEQPTTTPAAAVIEYISDEATEEKLKDLFDFYDADGNGMIQRAELIEVLALCAHEIGLEVDAYLEQIADAVFSNAKLTPCGSITFDGLRDVLRHRPNLVNELSLNNMGKSRELPKPKDACQGVVKFIAEKWDSMANSLSKHFPLCNKLRWEYISNNLVRFNFFLAVASISLALFVARIFTYWGNTGFLILARGSGQCLNFFCSMIVLLVCRRTITMLRSHGFGRYLPLDDHIYFHRMFGMFIVVHSILHTLGHLFNFLIVSQRPEAKFTYVQYLFSADTGIGWIGGCASLTGWLLLIIIIIMSSAQHFSRSLGKFELFYYTHLLYIPFWLLLFIHAPHFWAWFLGPFAVFFGEFLNRLRNLWSCLTSTDQTTIVKAVPLPSNVIHLVIRKPANFDYKPGDWIYVLIPQIAKYEWHPFTISSAPEQEGVIWLHIRAVGEWTRSLRSYFEDIENRNHLSKFIRSGQFSISMDNTYSTYSVMDLSTNDSAQILGAGRVRDKINQLRSSGSSLAPIPENKSIETVETQVSNVSGTTNPQQLNNSTYGESSRCSVTTSTYSRLGRQLPNITVYIDGPYGSPSSQIFRAEHAVLIATGIGVTPFASILQSIVSHYQKRRQSCPSCRHEFLDTRPPFVCKLRKVDFVWINRDQKSFEWFIKLLAELELTQSSLPQSERFLDIHIHLTAMQPSQTKSIGLQLALYLVHEKNKKDLITGLRTRTRAGRPDWPDFFRDIQNQKKGKVSVFFCGRPQLGRQLHRLCDSFGFKFRKEIF